MQILLEYAKWDTFKNVVEKAKIACKNSNVEPLEHFSEVGKTYRYMQANSEEMNLTAL